MSQTSKIVLALIIIAVVAGGGVYFWQQQKNVSSQNPESQLQETTKQPIQNTPVAKKEPDIVIQPKTELKLTTYSSEKYSFKYPEEYKVTEDGKGDTYILTVSGSGNSKLEIFKANEYLVDRTVIGFSGEETPEEAEAYIKQVQASRAKEYLKVDNYNVLLYYSENDSVTKKELMRIFDSIVIK